MMWRTIFTDSESETGVAPVCEQTIGVPVGLHENEPGVGHWVYDCCPHPHIETYSEPGATRLATLLTELDAGPCL